MKTINQPDKSKIYANL